MKAIVPCIWFDSVAEEAVDFYVNLFENSKVTNKSYYPEAAKEVSNKKAGTLLTAGFEINGQEFSVINAGGEFPLNESISFVISCKDQAEVDKYWDALTADGGSEGRCGWCKDKFGVSWQVIPEEMGKYVGNADPEKANKATAAMLQMNRIDLATLKAATEE